MIFVVYFLAKRYGPTVYTPDQVAEYTPVMVLSTAAGDCNTVRDDRSTIALARY